MNADVDVGSVGFLALYSLDVYDELLSVHLHNLTDLVAFVMAADHLKGRKSLSASIHNLKR